jgi:hypothetical protein
MALRTQLRPVPLLLVVALATACGSTVQGTSAVGVGGLSSPSAGGDGLGLTAPQVGGSTVGGGPAVGGAAPGSHGGPSDALVPGTPGSSVPGAALSGPGVTATKVYVGVIHDTNAGALNKAAGVGAITSGDTLANIRAVIKDINAHGGVGGRELVPVYASFDQTSTQTFDQQFSAICQQFTQDQPRVFAVIDAGVASAGAYRDCLTRAGVVIVSSSLPIVNAATLAAHPGFIELGYPNVDRLAAYQVTPLVAQHYFTPWNTLTGQPAATGTVKVGILTYDDRDFSQAVDRILVPALNRLGYHPLVAKISQLRGASDAGAQAAAVKSAQLQFAANGVTHVIPFESNGGLSTFFLPTARAQGYYPRYGGSTASAFEALLEAGVVEAKQMNGAVGYGWLPSIDLRAVDNPANGRYSNASTRSCLKVMHDNGIAFDSGNAEGIALNDCAVLYLIKTVLDRTQSQITLSTFVSIAERLGTSYVKAGGLGQDFRPGRHDPADKAYQWRFFADCTCFRYDGALATVP